MRNRYAAHLITLTHATPQLLITYEYDQPLYDGPPFSVPEEELKQHYGETYQLKQVAQDQIAGGLKGKVEAATVTWLLQRNTP
jgi:thiopurine S-methyltransferase